jgi:hypothetical protein
VSARGYSSVLAERERLRNRLVAVSPGGDKSDANALPLALHCRAEFYDAMPDGQRFLVNSLLDEAARTPITLVVNWRSLLGDQ